MQRFRLTLTCFCFALLSAAGLGKVQASHVYGAQVTYQCLNACTTRVFLRAYRDCAGASGITTSLTWVPEQAGCTAPPSIGGWSGQVTTAITPICPTSTTSCTTPGAPLSGFEEFLWYRDYDVCAVPACTFRLVHGSCCRNGNVTSMANASAQGLFISDTWIQTGLTQCNSSPVFRYPATLYICSGQGQSYDVGANDPDGDSLVYTLSACFSADSTPVPYNSGYSPTSPLGPSWPMVLDPATGQLDLIASPGNIVTAPICLTVDEYRNGQWIGRVQHDFQILVLTCTPNLTPYVFHYLNPSPNIQFSGTNLGSVCGMGPVCFEVLGGDNNPGQNLLLTWDRGLAGATFTEVGAPAVQDSIHGTSANPPRGRFCWTPPGPGRYFVTFRIFDDNCPLLGVRDQVVLLEVGSGSTASATLGACPSVNFTASPCASSGSYTYTWSGDGGFSSTLQNPSYTYPAVGDYAWQVVVSNGSVSDTIRDSVHILGDPVPLPSLFIPDTIALGPCLGATSAMITYQGAYAAYFASTGNVANPFPVNMAGTYYGEATDAAGCRVVDTVVVTWADADISGIVQTSTAQPLAGQKVYLIRYDSVAQTLYATDSSITDPTGAYFFCGVTDSVVFLKAAPDSAAYPLELPTYADTALFWSQAIAFHPFASLPIFHNFATRPGANPGGPGFIGGLITQGANKVEAVGDPIPGLTVVLREAVSGTAYAVTRTDANGYFCFHNLPLGDYEVVPDKPAVSITNVPQVSLTAAIPSRDSLDFRLNSTFLELHVASAIQTPRAPAWSLSPNPFSSEARLQLDLPAAALVEWRVLDLLGQVVEGGAPAQLLPAGKHRWRVAQDLAPGLYFVEIKVEGQTYVQKVLKAR
jgi:Carboxypeptidase regulatory-like domain/PKD domain